MQTFSEMFQKNKGNPLEVDGRVVVPIFKISFPAGSKQIGIRRISSDSASLAGLRIKSSNAAIEVNEHCGSDIVLWSDTSPDFVSLIASSRSEFELKFWNVWKAGNLTQAWVGNAGIVVSNFGDVIRLECSGGDVAINFSALVVEIYLN